MRRYVDAYVISLSKLKTNLKKEFSIETNDLLILDRALPEFSVKIEEDKFLIISNGSYGQNSYYGLIDFLERYFNTESCYAIVSSSVTAKCNIHVNANAADVAYVLGIELPQRKEY